MRRDSKITRINSNNPDTSVRIDDIDMKIIELLTFGQSSKQISDELEVPLSTIQRRKRKLGERELIVTRNEPNYEKLGIQTGVNTFVY